MAARFWIRIFAAGLWALAVGGAWPVAAQGASGPGAEAAAGFVPGPAWQEALAAAGDGDELQALFETVARGVRFAPYSGILRGATGTALARRGNALDQALLLRALLDRRGYRTRLVEGRLDEGNAHVLLRGAYPPELPAFAYGEDYAPFRPEGAEALLDTVERHFWVELEQSDGTWLPLDPSFPRARMGEAYAEALRRHDTPDARWRHRIAIRLRQQTADGQTRTLFEEERPVAALGYAPVLLSRTAVPLERAAAAPRRGSAARVFGGALGGAPAAEAPAEAPPQALGTRYLWRWHVPGGGTGAATHDVLDAEPGTAVARQWLELAWKPPGSPERRVERVLFEAGEDAERPPAYRRDVLVVLPGAVRPEVAEAVERRFAALPLERWKPSSDGGADAARLGEALEADAALNANLLQTLLLRFAAASDDLTDRIAYTNAVVPLRTVPRVLIASVEGTVDALRLDLDLRLDEVEALPYPGAPAAVRRLFQMGRGFAESVVEGAVLPAGTVRRAVTTAELMREAQGQGIPLRVVDERNVADFVARAGLPEPTARHLRASVGEGWEAVIPAWAVEIAGAPRWGWWRIERASGRTIGVMDTGLHAATVEYGLSSRDIGLSPRMGFAVGLINGAQSTLFAISGLLLQYGVTSEAMQKEVKAYLDAVLCRTCPKAEAKASAGSEVSGYCLKFEVETPSSRSAKARFDFCEKYVDGFKCAAGLLIAGLAGVQPEVKAGVGLSYEAGCRKGDLRYERKDKF